MRTYHQSRLALGSDTTFVLVTDRPEAEIEQLMAKLWLHTFAFERTFSRFIEDSELSQFNLHAGEEVPISAEFRQILVVAKHLNEQTGGLFNPMILPALQRAGYKQSHVERYANDAQIDFSGRLVAAMRQLELTNTTARIPHGTAIDLGGCGKGYLADQLAAEIPNWVTGYWLSFGGDVIGKGFDEHGDPWKVAIDQPGSNTDAYIETNGEQFCIATSAVTVRQGTYEGKAWHHIIDPRTQKPSTSDLIAATVAAKTAVEADVYASCAIILGSAEALPFLKQHDVSAARLQSSNDRSWEFGQIIKVGQAVT